MRNEMAGAIDRSLDAAAAVCGALSSGERALLSAVVAMVEGEVWRRRGCRSLRDWLVTEAGMTRTDAGQWSRLAGLCHRFPDLLAAVESGALSPSRARMLARFASTDREPFLAPSLATLLDAASFDREDRFVAVLGYWADLADQEIGVSAQPRHRLHASQRLFGGGEIHADLTPSAFANVLAAVDAHTQDPDPAAAPHRRSLSERRADALDDLCHRALVGGTTDVVGDAEGDPTFTDPGPEEVLDADADEAEASTGDLDALRACLQRRELRQRRRDRRQVKPRSGVAVDVHIDLATLAGRSVDDLAGLDVRVGSWALARRSAERLLCDASLTATLFAGPTRVLDANSTAERFSARQRRALAARDGHCVFPSCQVTARHCDAHHLQPRARGGPTTLDNAALLCRFHHRLVHEHGWSLEAVVASWTATDPWGRTWSGRSRRDTEPSGQSP